MALRSRSRTATPTSGPGRGRGSDGRTRHRLRHAQGPVRGHHRTRAADALRLRAGALFTEGNGARQELGHGPPRADGGAGEPCARTTAGSGIGPPNARAMGRPAADRSAGAVPAPTIRGADVPGSAVADGGWRERVGLAVRERMPLWLQSRCGLEKRSVAALSVLLVAAVVFAAQHFWSGRTQQVRAPEVVRAAASYGEPGARGANRFADPGASDGSPSSDAAGVPTGVAVVVDVGGKVRRPGLQRLPAGSRVADALRAAGGVRPGTDTGGLNRARLLVDGEQIVVGAPAPVPGVGAGAGAAGSGTGASAAGAAPGTPVSLTTATVDQLDALPGVGPVLAQHIVDYRARHGGFRSVDELREVNGIGERRFADLRNLVRP
ncbi:ComEA family DNA-binding protein [Streptomyces sp. MBT84]|uniref:ComEA family DNA-binding protein n=1 Tax=Streptomyces sp. MBT84 TaxID=1488414 RepID=UPI001C6E3C49|nr:ComEA family DNA-binding protein [Streptomyces sp. MBT84]